MEGNVRTATFIAVIGLFGQRDLLTFCFPAEKYDYVGKLLKPGEEPTEYTDDEEVKEVKDKKED